MGRIDLAGLVFLIVPLCASRASTTGCWQMRRRLRLWSCCRGLAAGGFEFLRLGRRMRVFSRRVGASCGTGPLTSDCAAFPGPVAPEHFSSKHGCCVIFSLLYPSVGFGAKPRVIFSFLYRCAALKRLFDARFERSATLGGRNGKDGRGRAERSTSLICANARGRFRLSAGLMMVSLRCGTKAKKSHEVRSFLLRCGTEAEKSPSERNVVVSDRPVVGQGADSAGEFLLSRNLTKSIKDKNESVRVFSGFLGLFGAIFGIVRATNFVKHQVKSLLNC